MRRLSLFAQRLDRAAFIAYFLGAVVPLAALVFLTHRYLAVADLEEGAGASLLRSRPLLLALIASIAVLSLASFLALRRTARQALHRFESDNQRLARLVRSSRLLSEARDRDQVLRIAVQRAAELCGARAVLCVAVGGGRGAALVESSGLGVERLYGTHAAALEEPAGRAVSTGAPAFLTLEGAGPADVVVAHQHVTSAIAVPCGAAHALVALFGEQSAGDKSINANLLSTLAGLAGSALTTVELLAAQRNFFVHVTQLLVAALNSHLGYHGDHSRNVAHLAVRIGRELGFDDERLRRLHFAALLHDVGMLSIPPQQVVDRRAIESHPGLGADMLERIELWQDLAPIVRHHHERWDGAGYPAGLAADAIPLEARIIGLAEAFDSMTSEQGYQPPVPVARALEEIELGAGTQFDPDLARRFVALAREGRLEPRG